MSAWYSIEVFDGSSSASLWSEAFGDSLVESALGYGAGDWTWHRHNWGVVFEVQLDDDAAWERFQLSEAVRVALEAVPDPLTGVIVYRGRGGSCGRTEPRRPRPLAGSGAAALPMPLPGDLGLEELTSVWALLNPLPVRMPATAGRLA